MFVHYISRSHLCVGMWMNARVCVIVGKVMVPMQFSYAYRCDQWIHLAVKGVSNAGAQSKDGDSGIQAA